MSVCSVGARQIAFSKKITYNWFLKIFFRLYLTQISQISTFGFNFFLKANVTIKIIRKTNFNLKTVNSLFESQ